MIIHLSSLFLALLLAGNINALIDVLTNRYNQFSQGANTQERELTAAITTKTFGKLYSYYVDGALYAQPLLVHNVATEKYGPRNVVFVATMNDKVYAFDAAQNVPPLWVRDLTDESAGVTPVPVSDITGSNDLNIVGNAGIEGTPVIDLAGQSLFLVARTKENGRYIQRLHKLDIRSGQDQTPPTLIEAHVPGSANDARAGFVHFDPKIGNQRPALALVNGSVIIAWASHEDLRPYHGWIMAYDAQSLKQIAALCMTPDSADGGIWQSGRGPAIDESGALYYEVGNGGWDGKRNFGNSVIKVRVDSTHLWVDDDYTPHDYMHQNSTDGDLGSSGPMLFPEDGILVCGNKQGALFLLNSSHLGGLTKTDAGILQQVDLKSGRVLAGPSYWKGPRGARLFVWNEAGFLEELRYGDKRLNPLVILKGRVASHGSPGGAVTVSSNGAKPGTGIVWATVGVGSADHGNTQGVLYAFNAETLQLLWKSETNAARDRLGTLVKFVPPLVADGKVYVPNYDNAVNVYGLLPNTQ
jgi:outer membrane protein assembly factor BamB